MSDLVEFIEFVDHARRYREVGPRRYLRDYSDSFTKYSVQEFHAQYRFTPETVKSVLLPMLTDLRKPTKRGLPFAPEIMLLLTLRYFATGSFQVIIDKLHENGWRCHEYLPAISATQYCQVSTLIARKMKDFVKFPSTMEGINTVKQNFYEIAHFPGVFGCIDCTHIKIRSPGGLTSEVYRNRKGWFSINVQAVTGPNLEFYDLVVRWPGSTHDSLIYNSSAIKQRMNTGVLKGIILGDSGYAVSNVLLTPFLSPNSSPQETYNRSQIKTRNTVERYFGIWERRFPCLQVGMGIKVDTVVAVICACATLHNVSILVDDLLPSNCNGNYIHDVDVAPITENHNSNGFLVRQTLVERFFLNVNYF